MTQFVSCDSSDRILFETMVYGRRWCHLTDIGTRPCDPPSHTTLLISCDSNQSLRNFLTCSKRYDRLRFPPIFRIVAGRITECFTLHDIVMKSALWGAEAIVGRHKLKIM